LREAALHAAIAWRHAIDGQGLMEGIPTAEVVGGYQFASAARFAVEPLTNGAAGLAHVIDEMVAFYRDAYEIIEDFNSHSVIPLLHPGRPASPEDVQAGEPSAQLALLEGRADDAVEILDRAFPKISDEYKDTRGYMSLQVLRLEAASFSEAQWREDNALAALQKIVEKEDVRWCACRLARVRARLDRRMGRPLEALQQLEAALPIASSWALGQHWLDLMTDHAALLCALGRLEEARATTRMLLIGESNDRSRWWNNPGPPPTGLHEGHRESILQGFRVFAGAEAEIPGLMEARASLNRSAI
jgi:tetratricopeptide (TPR) repeat protein